MIGRIYKLEGGDKFYIGSTTQDIKKRFKNHKSKSKEPHRLNTPLYKWFNEIGWENITVTIIEEFNAEKQEILKREDELIRLHIDNENCLNCNKVKITKDEKKESDKIYGKKRRQENPEYERLRLKEWRKNNPDKVREQTKRHNLKKSISSDK